MDRNNRVQYLVAFAVSLSAVASSASFSWITPVIPKLNSHEVGISITNNEISWMAAMASPGTMTGSLAARLCSDRIGRRASILVSVVPFIIGTALAMCATNAWMLYLVRSLWGLAAGMINVVSSIYLAEIANKEIRGTLSAGNRLMFNFGGFLMLAIGSFVTFQAINSMLVVLPVCYFVACWWIPESPYYLLKEGRVDDARRDLMKLQSQKEEKAVEDQLSLMRSDVRREMSRSGSAKELFTGKQYRKALIISIGLRITQLFAGSIPIQQYLGVVIKDSKIELLLSAPTALIIFGAVRFIVGILSSVIVDKVGRRPLLMFSYLAAGASLATVGTLFYFQDTVTDSSTRGVIIYLGILCFNITSTIGFDTLIFVVPSEIFPLNVKSIAMTLLNIMSSFFTFTSIRAYQIIKDVSGSHAVFWFYGTSALLGAIFTFFFVPETKGKSLREIQMELQGTLFDEADEKLNQVVSDSTKGKEGTELEELAKGCDKS